MDILIIGAGFAGIAAAKELGSKLGRNKKVRIKIFDKNSYTTLIPDLPDYAGERVSIEMLIGKPEKQFPKSVEFINEEVKAINLLNKKIFTARQAYNYDYLVIASGSVTNFYGFNQHIESIHSLTSLEEAKKLHLNFIKYINEKAKPVVLMIGAGYTGIELVSHLHNVAVKHNKEVEFILVEKGKSILPFLTPDLKEYVENYLNKEGFKLFTETSLDRFDGKTATLSNSMVLKDNCKRMPANSRTQ